MNDQQDSEPVGRVSGTADSTPLKFEVAVSPEQFLQLDDVVMTSRAMPDGQIVSSSGVVTEVKGRHEGAGWASDVFLIAQGQMPAEVQEVAEVTTTRVEPELYVPPMPGTPVFRADAAQRDEALYFDQMDRRLPVGLGRDGQPLFVNFDFVDGTKGAHVNVSGVSGVATKTTFSTFLLHAIFNSGVLGAAAANTKALIFSVKGEDLLFLDHANTRLDAEATGQYAALGLPATPFQSVGFYAPAVPGDMNGRPHVSSRVHGVHAFWWTIEEFCDQELLRFVFADAEDDSQQYTMIIHQVIAKLRREANRLPDGAVSIDGQTIRTYQQLVEFINDKLDDDTTRADWAGPATGVGTIGAFQRRLLSSQRVLSRLVRADLPDRPDRQVTTQHQVTVIDLHNLPQRAQRFVVGVVLSAEKARKEAAGTASLEFIMLDELNKYAPRQGSSPIAEELLDIAERGRSLGIILIGAQQTASEVERRVIANCSIKVVGRLDPAEASRPEYRFLPASQQQRATLAKPGSMFLVQPDIPVPLNLTFPWPSWATRVSEADLNAGPSGGPGQDHGDHDGGAAKQPQDPWMGLPGQDPSDAPF